MMNDDTTSSPRYCQHSGYRASPFNLHDTKSHYFLSIFNITGYSPYLSRYHFYFLCKEHIVASVCKNSCVLSSGIQDASVYRECCSHSCSPLWKAGVRKDYQAWRASYCQIRCYKPYEICLWNLRQILRRKRRSCKAKKCRSHRYASILVQLDFIAH